MIMESTVVHDTGNTGVAFLFSLLTFKEKLKYINVFLLL